MSVRRELGRFDTTMVVVGGIIGAGIFINAYIVAQRLDTPGLVLGAWIAGDAESREDIGSDPEAGR